MAIGLTFAMFTGFVSVTPAAAQTSQISTYRWNLGDYVARTGVGGATHFLLLGPYAGRVVNTRITLEFISADNWDAAGVHFEMFAPIQRPDGGIGTKADFRGSDFGWSGNGHFTVEYDTDVFNKGLILTSNNISIWPMNLNDFYDPYFGRFLEVKIEMEVLDLVADDYCPGDLNNDGELSPLDLLYFEVGDCPANGDPCPADLNNDGVITRDDRDLLIQYFGIVCPVEPTP